MIVIGTLRERIASWAFTDSINWMTRDLEKHDIKWMSAGVRATNIFKGREQVVSWLLGSDGLKDATHLLFIDSDEVFVPQTARLLYEWDLPVVSGIVYKKKHPHEPCIYKRIPGHPEDSFSLAPELKEWWDENAPNGKIGFPSILNVPREKALWEIDECGTGCMMIRRDVLEAIPYPRFKGMGAVGTDLSFCRRVREAGFDIFADLRIQLGHLVERPVTMADFLRTDEWVSVMRQSPEEEYRLYQEDE